MSCCVIDPVALAQDLIRSASVTPNDDGAIDTLVRALEPLGFQCHVLTFADNGPPIRNLYARRGSAGPNICFAGHTDVVPPGTNWTVEPFAGVIASDRLYGRGATDMKGAIACFIAAVSRLKGGRGSISLLITGDEEGPALDGTRQVLDWLSARGEVLDGCIVGEPTNPQSLGQMMKIGRRGSLNARVTVYGTQGHAAYPHLADNPIPRMLTLLGRLTAEPLDQGSAHFQPSNLEITSIDVGNATTNIIPAEIQARFNIRFNDLHSGTRLSAWIKSLCETYAGDHKLDIEISGESFLTAPGPLSDAVAAAARAVTGLTPELSTTGGTSDARFISRHCPVVEFGLITGSMHKSDEHVRLEDLERLTKIYQRVLYLLGVSAEDETSSYFSVN